MVTMLTMLALMAAPLPLLAAMHEHGGSSGMGSMDHGSMPMNHDGMMKDAGTAMLGDQTIEGVKALAHVRDVKAAMAKMGMKETHHFMVNFTGKDGKPVTEGTVAVKIKDPAGKESEPIALMGMQGHFGADITLTDKGTYEFKVGSKLPDGVARQYEFKYEVK
jgi:hypothetical protein